MSTRGFATALAELEDLLDRILTSFMPLALTRSPSKWAPYDSVLEKPYKVEKIGRWKKGALEKNVNLVNSTF